MCIRDSIYAFREAYDILRDMQPNPEFVGKVWIEQEEDWISIQSLDADFWENELAKELVLPPNTTLSKEKIAAHCIYDITFYGFSPAERIENFWKSHAPMQRKWNEGSPSYKNLLCLEAVSRTKIWLIYCKWNTVHDMIIIPLPTDKETD